MTASWGAICCVQKYRALPLCDAQNRADLLIIQIRMPFQAVCFPIYKIAKVRQAHYIMFDRHHLGYRNWFERFYCEYCTYANGLLA